MRIQTFIRACVHIVLIPKHQCLFPVVPNEESVQQHVAA